MRRWLIIAVLLVVLAALAAGGAILSGAFERAEPAAETDSAAEPTPVTAPAVAYFGLNGLMVPAVRNGRFRNYLSFDLKIEVPDEAAAIAARTKEPYLRDALLRSFSKQPVETRDGPADFDTETVRSRLSDIIHQVIGGDSAGEVLIIRVLPIRG